MKLTSDLLPEGLCVEETLYEIQGNEGCGKGHECVRKKILDPLSNEAVVLVNNAIAKCEYRREGLNACCAHDSLAIDLLIEQLEKVDETEASEEMITFLVFHKEAMEALDGVRITFEIGGDMKQQLDIFNSFIEEESFDITDTEKKLLLFSDSFINSEQQSLVAAIKIREVILGKKVEAIRDFVLEYAREKEDDFY